MNGKGPRAKGQRGERELRDFLTEHLGGLPLARRGRQDRGGHEEPDVVGVGGWWVEGKRAEDPRIIPWWRKLLADMAAARTLDRPLLCWRPNGKPNGWIAVLRLSDWCALVQLCEALMVECDELRKGLGMPARPRPEHTPGRQLTIDEVTS